MSDIVRLPDLKIDDEEKARRVMAGAVRLANLAPGEWRIWLKRDAERLGVPPETLEQLVKDRLKELEKAKRQADAEERRREQRVERRHKSEQQQAERKAEGEQRLAEKKAEQERREAEEAAAKKAAVKVKGFGIIMRLPVALHERELGKLAKQIDEDLTALRSEFQEYIGVAEGSPLVETEAWPEPIDLAELLTAVEAKIAAYVAMRPLQRVAVTLFAAQAWPHNAIATHSPILVASSPEPDSGKTTLLGVVGRLTPKATFHIETTAANMFRLIDAHQPTVIVDEADDVFVRKSDLKHVITGSWTRGATVPRIVQGISRDFNIFSPKAIGLLSNKLPRALHTRGIQIKMRPKRNDEAVEPFRHVDDPELALLRRKLKRFAVDYANTLKTMEPTFPKGMANRAADNWRLLLCVGELAGGDWPERARAAAELLTRRGKQPSDGVKLLEAIWHIFAVSGKRVLTSKEIVAALVKNPEAVWCEYHNGRPITPQQIGLLLDRYDINPDVVHPSGNAFSSPRGYRLEWFTEAFASYLSKNTPEKPHLRTQLKSPPKPRAKKKRVEPRRKLK
jgi:putative DNA primase/helicase